MAKTNRSFTIDDTLWQRGLKATETGVSLSYVLSLLLEQWLDGKIGLTTTHEPLKKKDKLS